MILRRCFRRVQGVSGRALSSLCPKISADARILNLVASFPVTDDPAAKRQWFAQLQSRKLHQDICEASQVTGNEIHANSDTGLESIVAYGFDYDHTIACYTQAVDDFVYREAKKTLIEKLHYPKPLLKRSYNPKFGIRGLMFDRATGYLLKLDQFCNITMDSVHMGHTRVSPKEVEAAYSGTRLPISYVYEQMYMYNDLFSLPEICLIADAAQTFQDEGVSFDPGYLWTDVRESVEQVHQTGDLHNAIINNPENFLEKTDLGPYFEALRDNGKKVFLLTNSPFRFVDAGMRFLLEPFCATAGRQKWTELFDLVICGAKKPNFFVKENHPFRKISEADASVDFNRVKKFEPHGTYNSGCLNGLTELTGWQPGNTMYFGDHLQSDLVKPQQVGWKTCAVVKELERECKILSNPAFRDSVGTTLVIEEIIGRGQVLVHLPFNEQVKLSGGGWEDGWAAGIAHRLRLIKEERQRLRRLLYRTKNERFGSVFRTASGRTFYFHMLSRFADLYTSSLGNFLRLPLDYTFYAGRDFLPHEVKPWA